MTEIRTEAKELEKQLKSGNAKIRSAAMEKSRELLGEYVALIDKGRSGREADAPWEYVGAMKKSTMKDPSAQKMTNTPEKASELMGVIASGSMSAFQNKLKQGLNAAAAETAAKVPLEVRPGHLINGPEDPKAPTI